MQNTKCKRLDMNRYCDAAIILRYLLLHLLRPAKACVAIAVYKHYNINLSESQSKALSYFQMSPKYSLNSRFLRWNKNKTVRQRKGTPKNAGLRQLYTLYSIFE